MNLHTFGIIALSAFVPLIASAAGGTTSPCPNITRHLEWGNRGGDVVQLQLFLISQNLLSADSATGYFGPLTTSALQSWQISRGIVSSGTPATTGFGAVGPLTRASLQDCATIPVGSVIASPPVACPVGTTGTYPACSSASSSKELEVCPVGTTGTFPNCTVPEPAGCPFNGMTIANGQSITAYQSSVAPYGQQCVSETRACSKGVLSGSYVNGSCVAAAVTSDGCAIWPSSLDASLSLQTAVTAVACVSIAPGTHLLSSGVILPSGHTLTGPGATQATLKADPQLWQLGANDAIVTSLGPNVFVSNLTLDGSGLATYDFIGSGTTMRDNILMDGRCSAVGTGGMGLVVRNNILKNAGQPTVVPGRGSFTCASNPNNIPQYGGVQYGGGIYAQGSVGNYDLAPVIDGNTIINSYGPALDINTVNGGIVIRNIIYGNASEAAINLFQSSGWTVSSNQVSHPADATTTPYNTYHPACVGGPVGAHAAAIEICADASADQKAQPQPATKNHITGNHFSSYYGILLLGAGTAQNPSLSAYGNEIEDNDVYGSVIGCADGFQQNWATNAVPANVWKGNNCAGTPNTPPMYF